MDDFPRAVGECGGGGVAEGDDAEEGGHVVQGGDVDDLGDFAAADEADVDGAGGHVELLKREVSG